MSIHESGINFRNLIKDLADMYPEEVSDVVISELIANSLDAKASTISISYNREEKVLVFTDNGKGMEKSQFDEYHDFAASLKSRGTGIGFAGLGAKISFNVANQVITETKSDCFLGGSNWYLKSNKKLVWEEIEPKHLKNNGTRVEIRFKTNANVSYSNSEDIIRIIKSQYLPLLDIRFLKLYKKTGIYPETLRFVVNGKIVEPLNCAKYYSLSKFREFTPKIKNKRIGYGYMGLADKEYPVAENRCGILLCTYGKIIKSELFNQFPGQFGTKIFGMVEIKEFINFLTTSKNDFTRKGKFKKFESLYSPIREEFKEWLKVLGVESSEIIARNEALRLEKEINKILDEIPELSYFFGFYSRQNIMTPSNKGEKNSEIQDGIAITYPEGQGDKGNGDGVVDVGDQPGEALVENKENGSVKTKPISRSIKRGPKCSFADDKDRFEMSWTEGNHIIINKGHPCYDKMKTNKIASLLYNLFAIASAVQKFKGMEDVKEKPDFYLIDRIMTAWAKK